MSNQKTIYVRDAQGRLLRFALLEANSKAVFVCKEELWERTASGELPMPMSGFPIEDAYTATADLGAVLEGTPREHGLTRFTHA